MCSATAEFLKRGSYIFRISGFRALVFSDQKKGQYDPRVLIHLEFQRKPEMWPEKFWPIDARIVCGTPAGFDVIGDNQIVLGLVQRMKFPADERKMSLALMASINLVPSYLEALNQKHSAVFLEVETFTKVEEWNAEDWIAVLSFHLSFGSDCPN